MNSILKFLIEATSLSAILVFLGKFILNYIRDTRLEKYKNDLEIESLKFKSDLDKHLEKYKISYSGLYQEQLIIIKETYKKLIRAEKPLEYLMRPVKFGPTKTKEESADEVVRKANELFDYYDENEVIFSDNSVKIFKAIRQKYFDVWDTFSITQAMGENVSNEMKNKLIKDMVDAYEKILQGEMQKLKLTLKVDFQRQLGLID